MDSINLDRENYTANSFHLYIPIKDLATLSGIMIFCREAQY